jgi:hypothetical protein
MRQLRKANLLLKGATVPPCKTYVDGKELSSCQTVQRGWWLVVWLNALDRRKTGSSSRLRKL